MHLTLEGFFEVPESTAVSLLNIWKVKLLLILGNQILQWFKQFKFQGINSKFSFLLCEIVLAEINYFQRQISKNRIYCSFVKKNTLLC